MVPNTRDALQSNNHSEGAGTGPGQSQWIQASFEELVFVRYEYIREIIFV